jgi:hypothetical protein
MAVSNQMHAIRAYVGMHSCRCLYAARPRSAPFCMRADHTPLMHVVPRASNLTITSKHVEQLQQAHGGYLGAARCNTLPAAVALSLGIQLCTKEPCNPLPTCHSGPLTTCTALACIHAPAGAAWVAGGTTDCSSAREAQSPSRQGCASAPQPTQSTGPRNLNWPQ